MNYSVESVHKLHPVKNKKLVKVGSKYILISIMASKPNLNIFFLILIIMYFYIVYYVLIDYVHYSYFYFSYVI